MARKPQDMPADIRAEQTRETRIRQVNAFAETMHQAQLPEPFAGAVLTAVREWSALADVTLWEELRAENAEARVEQMLTDYERLTRGDPNHPLVAQLVERVTSRALAQVIAIMARDAGVPEGVMAATIAALTGQPVPPATRDAVWALLERAATGMSDHPAGAQQEAG